MPDKPVVHVKYSDEYLDLVLEWGTVADIPDLVRAIAALKQALDDREHDIVRLQEEIEGLQK